MIITHNITAMNTGRIVSGLSKKIAKNAERLGSGYKVNRSADDAAGLAISEKMRAQIRGLGRASENAQDGISFIQVAEGALGESHAILQRCKELTTQGANDTNTDTDRAAIQAEIDELTKQLDTLADKTKFNTLDVFLTDGISKVAAGSKGAGNVNEVSINVQWALVDTAGNVVSVADSQPVGKDTNYNNTDFTNFVEKAAADAVASLYNNFGSTLFSTSSQTINIGLNLATIDGGGGTLASAALSMSASSTYTTMSYTLNIDKADYDAAKFSTMTDAEKADLAATIAHEMTHLVMYDTLTDGMISGTTESFPKWFVEGMAQTSSGDGGWVSGQISTASTDAQLKNYMSQMSTMPYGAGYLATMFLGYAANGNATAVSQQAITEGLNNIFTSLANGSTMDEAIRDNTGYAGLSDFESVFKNADSEALTFVKELLAARGQNGAGSLFAELNVSQEDAFADSTLTDSHNNYVVNSDNTRYMNAFGTGYTIPEKMSGTAGGSEELLLQVGALENQNVALQRYDVSAAALFGNKTLDVSSHELAGASMTTEDEAIQRVSTIRSYYGALQNRLEKTISNLDYTQENVQQSESRIRDTDMADEMVEYSKHNILLQAGQSMLSQANKSTQGILTLLQ